MVLLRYSICYCF